MATMKCILGLLALLAVSAWTEAGIVMQASGDNDADNDPTVTDQLENANKDLSKVYIPYAIANHYSSKELDVIQRGINSFSYSTCIRFYPRRNERDYIYIQSLEGCYSFVGRQGNTQTLSLSRRGCIYYGTVQHELLHALGFNHEQCRSDRDQHIRVLLQNIIKGQAYNFNKINTLNQGTPYDYGSVMHYGRLAFSKDNQSPTMVAVPNPKAVFGTARQMSQNDINRINLLYCRN
ncbi:low choriolytic enzyme-like [Plectropomus leopardus]|uniref:low choriolytic enzyme-like n=1 Tax=Plectropomus leopardus TaxID=160734 RepID=UPI001C4C97B7|nr:low choriolytic enzyme-like [Plectropomus leopardus]